MKEPKSMRKRSRQKNQTQDDFAPATLTAGQKVDIVRRELDLIKQQHEL